MLGWFGIGWIGLVLYVWFLVGLVWLGWWCCLGCWIGSVGEFVFVVILGVFVIWFVVVGVIGFVGKSSVVLGWIWLVWLVCVVDIDWFCWYVLVFCLVDSVWWLLCSLGWGLLLIGSRYFLLVLLVGVWVMVVGGRIVLLRVVWFIVWIVMLGLGVFSWSLVLLVLLVLVWVLVVLLVVLGWIGFWFCRVWEWRSCFGWLVGLSGWVWIG